MLIADVLRQHEATAHARAHADILGDAFLLNENSVYRNVKTCALELGTSFVEAWPQYLLLPFNELHRIVSTRTVPFVPTARLLRGVEDVRANVFTMDDVPLPDSYHLHEASHVVAEHLFEGARVKSRDDVVLKTIMCESFANTVDALACVPASTDEHRFFIAVNCYMKPRKSTMETMARLDRKLGPRFTFMLTLMTYVHANFLRESVPDDVITWLRERYAPTVEFNAATLKDCATIARLGAKLDPLFRIQTTSVYFRMLGFDDDIFDLLDIPLVETFRAHPDLLNVAERMADVVTAP